jgi:hypothetical protein
VDREGAQEIKLRQDVSAFDIPDVYVRYVGGASHMTPAWYIEEQAAAGWVQEEGEIQWADNITINGTEYLMAEFIGNRYKTFWLFALPEAPDKDYAPAASNYVVFEFEWTDLAGARPLLETVEIDWSAAP